jgi:hypothetical protein
VQNVAGACRGGRRGRGGGSLKHETLKSELTITTHKSKNICKIDNPKCLVACYNHYNHSYLKFIIINDFLFISNNYHYLIKKN